MATVFPELVRALHMFPNMHSLQIISSVKLELLDAFEGHTFPTVKHLVLNDPVYSLIKSFPQVQAFYTHDYFVFNYPWQEVVLPNWEAIARRQWMFADRYILTRGVAFPITVFVIPCSFFSFSNGQVATIEIS
jgi:hypothetical protein